MTHRIRRPSTAPAPLLLALALLAPAVLAPAPAAAQAAATATAASPRPGPAAATGPAPAAAGVAASPAANAAAPPSAAHAVEGPSFMPMALALAAILGLIGAALWVMRRMGLAPRGGTGQLRLVTQLALGPRERVVIVEAGERWWMLGVGAGGITRLGSMPKGENAGAEAPVASFNALLARMRAGAP
jgi:flagellar protein FliO/FliZ